MPLITIQSLVKSQIWLSTWFDRLLPRDYRIDGNSTFSKELAPQYIAKGQTIYDVGGGKNPHIGLHVKRALGLHVVGVDISADELRQAPPGAYDETVCTDIASHHGTGDADLVICQAVLEHVSDVGRAFQALAEMLKPGGRALIFVPSRNAAYARLNLILPERLKRWILYSIFPQTRAGQGFRSYYHLCTPQDFRQLAHANGLEVERLDAYYVSGYFRFFFPLYVVWRLWVLFFRLYAKEQAAEAFSLVLRRPTRSCNA